MVKYFHFHTPTFNFDGQLESTQCEFIKKNKEQCKRRSLIGRPMCRPHLEQTYKVQIKDSNIEDAGLGLFAKDKSKDENALVFSKGQLIVPYAGQLFKKKGSQEAQKRYGDYTAPYGITLSYNRFEDGALQRGVGTLVNHTEEEMDANAELRDSGRKKGAVIRAKKKIYNGDEILVNYGTDYLFDEVGVEYATNNRKKKL